MLIFLAIMYLVMAQINVPFTIEATSKLVPVSLKIEKNFV